MRVRTTSVGVYVTNGVWTIAKKEARLLLRDPKAGLILLAMPVVFIFVVGLSLGEGFGQKPDDRLRISVVDLDRGYVDPVYVASEIGALLSSAGPASAFATPVDPSLLRSQAAFAAAYSRQFPKEPWSKIVQRDLADSDIRVETIASVDKARQLVNAGKLAAVMVFGPEFSHRVHQSSFLAEGINPFYREGVKLSELDAEVLSDPTQVTASSIIKQVGQVSLCA